MAWPLEMSVPSIVAENEPFRTLVIVTEGVSISVVA